MAEANFGRNGKIAKNNNVQGAGKEGPFPLAPGEYFLTCPYDISHRVTNQRILNHLAKCRRNYIKQMEAMDQEVSIVACKFNYTHQMPMAEIRFHEERCEDQWSVIQHIDYITSDFHQNRKHVLRERVSVQKKQEAEAEAKAELDGFPQEEDWEESMVSEEYRGGYDPIAKLEDQPSIYMQGFLTSSEKKEFRAAHRKLFAEKRLGNQDELVKSGKVQTQFVQNPHEAMMSKMNLKSDDADEAICDTFTSMINSIKNDRDLALSQKLSSATKTTEGTGVNKATFGCRSGTGADTVTVTVTDTDSSSIVAKSSTTFATATSKKEASNWDLN